MDYTGDITIKEASDITFGFEYFDNFLPKTWGYAVVYKITTLWLIDYFPGLAHVVILALELTLLLHFCEICYLIASLPLANTCDLWQDIKDDMQLLMSPVSTRVACK